MAARIRPNEKSYMTRVTTANMASYRGRELHQGSPRNWSEQKPSSESQVCCLRRSGGRFRSTIALSGSPSNPRLHRTLNLPLHPESQPRLKPLEVAWLVLPL